MALEVRPACPNDLPSIRSLTARKRRQLAAWEPHFWAMAEGSDALHGAWLARLVATDHIVTRVVDEAGGVVGFAVSIPKRDRWVVDDVSVAADQRWDDAGAASRWRV